MGYCRPRSRDCETTFLPDIFRDRWDTVACEPAGSSTYCDAGSSCFPTRCAPWGRLRTRAALHSYFAVPVIRGPVDSVWGCPWGRSGAVRPEGRLGGDTLILLSGRHVCAGVQPNKDAGPTQDVRLAVHRC